MRGLKDQVHVTKVNVGAISRNFLEKFVNFLKIHILQLYFFFEGGGSGSSRDNSDLISSQTERRNVQDVDEFNIPGM